MRAAEAEWFAAGNNSFALMQVAATAVAAEVRSEFPVPGRVLVLAGPGNNGGDACLVAGLLEAAGHRVELALVVAPARLRGDAQAAFGNWRGKTIPVQDVNLHNYDIVIDGLFGIGLQRPLEGPIAALVDACNGAELPVVAIDIPSGVDADSGAVRGTAIRARTTVTFHRAKPGHYLYPGRAQRGRLVIADIGLPPTDTNSAVNHPEAWGGHFPVPSADSHKYTRGGALVWSGPVLRTGAARLAARAALRIGAGAVTLAGDHDALMVHAAQVSAIMLAEAGLPDLRELLEDSRIRAVCVGPGAGVGAVRPVAEIALQSGRAVVLDADALTAFAGAVESLRHHIAASVRPVVLTPHEGEFSRLFPDYCGGKFARARSAAAALGAIVVLKGADTIIAAPDGRAMINCNAPPWLASAGSGDTLCGFVTGLLAQGMPGFEAAAAAVWVHGAAGSLLGPGLIADDLAGPEVRLILSGLTKAGEVQSGWL